jgi:hypothetical protein
MMMIFFFFTVILMLNVLIGKAKTLISISLFLILMIFCMLQPSLNPSSLFPFFYAHSTFYFCF